MTSLILIRGLPGSGKTTLVRQLKTNNYVHFEVDHYFEDNYGNYNFDRTKLSKAHEWCRTSTIEALEQNKNVIVSNTFTTINELRPYFIIAKDYKIVPSVILCQNKFNSIHNVPEETYKKMKERFCFNIGELYEQYCKFE